ncbi:MAG: 16S rRNA (guanine(966)-N(2))-methyltransferase RsmD, partial [Gemmatimonadales bacterium]
GGGRVGTTLAVTNRNPKSAIRNSMVRIIAGELKGRRLKIPAGRTVRPTSDRVREAWFSIIQAEIPGARVLDLFAGSGALGLEALSRGAAAVDFVETHRDSLAVLAANTTALRVENRVTIHRTDALRFAELLQPGQYDVAFADPPYATDHADRLADLFRSIPFARVFSIEHSADRPLVGDDTRRWGDTAVTFLYAPSPSSTHLHQPPPTS